MRNVAFLCGLAIVAMVVAPANGQLFTEDFEGGLESWTHVTAGWGSNYESIITTPGAGGVGRALRNGWANGSGSGSQARLHEITIPGDVFSVDISLQWKNIKGGANGWYEVLLLTNSGNWDAPNNEPAGFGILQKEEYGFGTDNAVQTWHDLVLNSIAVTPGATYTLGLKTGGSPANGNQGWFDNLVVTPEPASLAMLGLGGLPLLLRRRHRM